VRSVPGRLTTPYEGRPAPGWDPAALIPAPLALHATTVPPEWVDYNGHLSESCYLRVVGDSTDALFRYLGVDEDYREGGHSFYTLATQLHHLGQAALGERLEVGLIVLGADAKRWHLVQTVSRDALVLATAEQVLIHVDTRAGRSEPMPGWLAERVAAVVEAHAGLTRPATVGRPLALTRPRS
jgi:acyl-CoA thioester hydrolase